ncbi:refractory to sigma P [Halictus rubicundus]|uniref:refractory to sigma P n=1 Tax=Halictus rubicundus TaxID=77578 RepID=UPI0040360D52
MNFYHSKHINCKVFLKNHDGSNIEIRRFDSCNLPSTEFEPLRKKLKEVFPELRDKSFTVSWIDEDNDEIRITNNTELSIALNIANESFRKYRGTFLLDRPILKLFVKLNQKDKNTRFFQGEVTHGNVICDGCDNTISGFRYKCLTCEDYDLCSKCETLGLHAEHVMLRMLRPLNLSTFTGKCLLDHIKNFLRRKGLDYSNRESSGHETQQEKQPEENVATQKNIVEESPKRNTKLIDLTVNESSSLGCNAFISQQFLSDNSTTSPVNPLVEGWTILDKSDISPASSVSSHLNESSESDQLLPTAPVATTTETTSAAPSVITPVTTSASASAATSVITPVITLVTTSAITSATTPATTSATTSATTPATIPATIPATTPATTPATIPAPAAHKLLPQHIYPQLPKESRIHHPNPRIHNALITMISMGFSNDGGVLTHLLEIENGDINKVIDTLEYGKR